MKRRWAQSRSATAASIPLAVALLGGLTFGLARCSQQGLAGDAGGGTTCACEGTPVVDAALLAFLSKARAAHHAADDAERAGERANAIAVLDRLAAGPRPGLGGVPPPEVAEVLADTHARLADLRSADGDFTRAARDVDQGLTLATTPTHFRGHLVEMRGVVEERRSISLKEKGDEPGAEEARKAAILAFEQAIEIQDDVIKRTLGDAGLPQGGGGP